VTGPPEPYGLAGVVVEPLASEIEAKDDRVRTFRHHFPHAQFEGRRHRW
jgi:hypothetical protein